MIICRQNKHTFVLFTLENILVSSRALRPLVREHKYSAGSPNWFSQFRDEVVFMSTREGGKTRGLFRRRWTKVCGALEKTAADLGLSPSDEEAVANVLAMTPPKSAGKRGTRSPSRSRSRTPPPSTSSAPTPPRLASFSKPPTGTNQKSTKEPQLPVGKIKAEPDDNNNASDDVSHFLPLRTLFRWFCVFWQNNVL